MQAVAPADVSAAYERCRQVVAARAKSFAYAFLLLPPARRRGLEAVYAYCRVADDFADDEGLTPAERARNLADLRARLRIAVPAPGDGSPTALPPDAELDPMLLALRDTALRFGVTHADLDLVAQGCEQDLTVRRYETWDDLYAYCYQVASAVGLACLDVFGYRGDREAARAEAVDLGIAMQLTNILRDVAEDWARDRVYLPQEDLRRFCVDEAALAAGRADARWRALAAFEVARAREYFARGKRLAARVRRRSRVCPLALAAVYEQLLDEIERADYDVFAARVSVSSRRKLRLLARCLAAVPSGRTA